MPGKRGGGGGGLSPNATAGAQQPKITEMFTKEQPKITETLTKGTPKTALKADRLPITKVCTDNSSQEEVEMNSPAALHCDAGNMSSLAGASPLLAEVRSARKSKLSLKRMTSPAGDGAVIREEERRAEEWRRDQLREEARRRHLREEEDRRVQERWEREELLTLASSFVPKLAGGPSRSHALPHQRTPARLSCPPQEVVFETDDDEEEGTLQTSPCGGQAQTRGGWACRQATECIHVMDSSQEECEQEEDREPVDIGTEGTRGDRHGGDDCGKTAMGAERDWEVDVDETLNGVLVEDEPDDEDLGEYARPKSPVLMTSRPFRHDAGSASADGNGRGSSMHAPCAGARSHELENFGQMQDMASFREPGSGDWNEDERRSVALDTSWEDMDGNKKEKKQTQVDKEGEEEDEEGEEEDWESDEAEAFMQRLRRQGALLSEPDYTDKQRDALDDAPLGDAEGEQEEEEEARRKDGKGRGRAGQGATSSRVRGRIGYWMTERYGPHKSQYKRVYVDGSGKKFTGRFAFAAAKLDGKQPGANKKKASSSSKKNVADETETGVPPRTGQKAPVLRKGGGAGGAGGKKAAKQAGEQLKNVEFMKRVGSQSSSAARASSALPGFGAAEPDAGKGKFIISSRAAALVGMATSSASHSSAKASGRGGAGGAGAGAGAGTGAGAKRGIRGMFLKIGVP